MASMVIWKCPETETEAVWVKGDDYFVQLYRKGFPEHLNLLRCVSRGHAIAKAKRWARKLRRVDTTPAQN